MQQQQPLIVYKIHTLLLLLLYDSFTMPLSDATAPSVALSVAPGVAPSTSLALANDHDHIVLNPFTSRDTLYIILDYLPVRSLFNVAFCNKTILAAVSYEQVVRSALMAGGDSFTIASDVAKLLKKGTIYTPSVPRLLRLTVTGMGCESCGSPSKERSYEYQDLGLPLCHRCSVARLKRRRTTSAKKRHPLLAGIQYTNMVISLRGPYRTRDGEWAGPILTYEDAACREPRWDEILAQHEEHRNLHKHHAQCIIYTVDALSEKADENYRALEELKEEQIESAYEKKQTKLYARKLARTQQVLQEFFSYLDGTKEWALLVTNHSYDTRPFTDFDDVRNWSVVKFESCFLEEKLGKFTCYLRLANHDTLKKAAEEVTSQFDQLYRCGFDRFDSQWRTSFVLFGKYGLRESSNQARVV